MKHLAKGLIVTFGAFLLTAGASAQNYSNHARTYFQDRDRDGDRGRDGDRDRGQWDRERMAREYRGAFYDRLQADLTRAESARYLRGDEFGRIQRAHREVSEFQSKWSRGVFDAHEMDSAIASVQRVLDIPSLHQDDREALRDDLFAMRRFRAHMEGRRY
jgi:hypothetical protein